MNNVSIITSFVIQQLIVPDNYQSCSNAHTKPNITRQRDASHTSMLTPTDIANNHAQQAQEIAACGAIFDNDFAVLDNRTIRCKIHVELTDEIIKIRAASSILADKCRVRHLPPMMLTAIYDDNYPSSSPPAVEIDCEWLVASHLESLKEKLHELWVEGSVVVFVWVGWLRENCLTFLGFEGELRLLHKREAEAVLAYLLDYNRMKCREAFEGCQQSCRICLEEAMGSSMILLEECEHFYCRVCW